MALVTNIQPPLGDPVGVDEAITFDVVDPVISELKIYVWAVFRDGTPTELAYDAQNFQAAYSFSQISTIPNGRRFSIRRVAGWTSQPELRVDTGYNPPDLASILAAVGSGEANTASNVGGGTELFQLKSDVDLRFRTLQSTSIDLTQNSTTVDLEIPNGFGVRRAYGTFTYLSAGSAVNIGDALPANAIVTRVTVEIGTAFNGACTLDVGITGTANLLMANTLVKEGTADSYHVSLHESGAASSQVILTMGASTATAGSGAVLVEYILSA